MARKNIKVSEIVHEELEVRKRRDESFDDVLKRELGIIPNTVEELTTYYPDALHEPITFLAKNFEDDDRYHQFVTEHDDYYALNYDSKDTGRTILQLRFHNNPPRVGTHYRNNAGEMEHIGDILQQEDDDYIIADFTFTRPDTGERFEDIATYHEINDRLEEGLKSIQNAAYERWG
jgi:hypothetical protein